MEQQAVQTKKRQIVAAAALIAAVYFGRHALSALLIQLAGGYVLMALALPLSRRLERRFSPGTAAVLSLLMLGLALLGALVLLIPPLTRQLRQVTASFPGLVSWAESWLSRGQTFLSSKGVDLSPVKEELFGAISSRAGEIVSLVANLAGQTVQVLGKLFLAPLIGFYLLRDRRKISSLLMLLLPVKHRARAVRAAREMRRETAGFLRGQILVSAAVAVLTALGLMLAGTQGYLVLGILMGVMELVPYVGPVLAGIPAILMALQGGLWQALWTILVLLAVQQIEGSVLSPRLLSGATRLHPLVVLLAVSAGGIFAGTLGMILALPVVVSIRGALRGLRRQQV